jgi:hypothetical protein
MTEDLVHAQAEALLQAMVQEAVRKGLTHEAFLLDLLQLREERRLSDPLLVTLRAKERIDGRGRTHAPRHPPQDTR